jgi:hypothetical protein
MNPRNLSREAVSGHDNLQDVITRISRLNLEFMWGIENARSQINKQDSSGTNTPDNSNLKREVQQSIRGYGMALIELADLIDTKTGIILISP